jgi:two-component system response regulator MtrA
VAAVVVVLEDDSDVRELLDVLLTAEGFQVVALHHPRMVQRLDPTTPPALFLLDLIVPGASGLEVAQQLRTRGFTTPIIAISVSRLQLAIAAGSGLFDALVYKPFDLAELVACVRQALAAHSERTGVSISSSPVRGLVREVRSNRVPPSGDGRDGR